MSENLILQNADQILQNLANGGFLTTHNPSTNSTNTMTISWGNLGINWNKTTFAILVRKSRFSYELLNKSNEFTLSIPVNSLQKELTFCGKNSGRIVDKIKLLELEINPSKSIITPTIQTNGFHLECKTICKLDLNQDDLPQNIVKNHYKNNDLHTVMFAEILNFTKSNNNS